jgi:GNAT superfamily N-acetyltransferase
VEAMDRLVRLYDLPALEPFRKDARLRGVVVRRARAYEQIEIVEWVRENFSIEWASECNVCFSRIPLSCFIATREGRIIGFACYEATFRNFFGPIGVDEQSRGANIGALLLLSCLRAMWDEGYAYAIIGGPREAAPFYRRIANAVDIEGSTPGIYIDRLARD